MRSTLAGVIGLIATTTVVSLVGQAARVFPGIDIRVPVPAAYVPAGSAAEVEPIGALRH
jgi:hypothetical protein